MPKQKKKTVKKKAKTSEYNGFFLSVCSDCKIKLGVKKENTGACYLCKSPNITVTKWS